MTRTEIACNSLFMFRISKESTDRNRVLTHQPEPQPQPPNFALAVRKYVRPRMSNVLGSVLPGIPSTTGGWRLATLFTPALTLKRPLMSHSPNTSKRLYAVVPGVVDCGSETVLSDRMAPR